MKIFITGVESFIGHYLLDILQKKNFQVLGIDNKKKNSFTKKFNINNKNLFKIIPKIVIV